MKNFFKTIFNYFIMGIIELILAAALAIPFIATIIF